jgi:hypothetical protein
MLARRVGIPSMSSEPKRVPNPGFRASMREPVPSTTIDSSTPARFSVAVLSIVEPAAIKMSRSRNFAKPGISISSAYTPGGRIGNRSWPLSSVICVAGPPISAGELMLTRAPARARPCSSLTVPRASPSAPAPRRLAASGRSRQRPTAIGSAGLAGRTTVASESSCTSSLRAKSHEEG